MRVTGISIGGGNIQISEVDGFKINLSMGTPTLIVVQKDVPGVIAKASHILQEANINIGTMSVTRSVKGEKAFMILEIDERDLGSLLNKSSKYRIFIPFHFLTKGGHLCLILLKN